MSAATPGPWDCGYQNAMFGEYAVGTGLRCVATVHANGRGDPEALANCNVIRAAPDLLHALDYLLGQTVDMGRKYGVGLTEWGDARHVALAAIAKARGGTYRRDDEE